MAGADFEKLRILILDGSQYSRLLTSALLRSMGVMEIYFAQDGDEGIDVLRRHAIDIAITEWIMAPMDGLKFASALRREKNSPNRMLPVIALTGHTDREFICKARDAGVNEILTKPISLDTLYRRIVSLIVSPRAFVEKGEYFGPDRRRHKDDEYLGPKKRGGDPDDVDTSIRMEG